MSASNPPVAVINAVNKLIKVAIGGSIAVYAANNCIFNVEGGHRAVVFNRFVGIKEDVSGFSFCAHTSRFALFSTQNLLPGYHSTCEIYINTSIM